MARSWLKRPIEEYWRYLETLNDAEYEKECRKVYQITEYVVIEVDEHGDMIDTRYFDTLKEAQREAKNIDGDTVIEKRITKHRGADLSLIEDEYETVE